MIQRVASFFLLLATWLLWSGHFSLDGKHPLVPIFGLASCIFVSWLAWRMDHVSGDSARYGLSIRPVFYAPWLLWEIIKANIDVAKIVLFNKPISPRLIRVTASQKTELGKTIYANSITLTPGTITLDVRDDKLLIHALTKESADGVRSGVMDRKVAALEGQDR